MKRVEPESIGDVLRQTLEQQGMTERLYEVKAISLWPAVVGEEIASLTSRPSVANGVMTVHVGTAPLRQELNMNRSGLIRILNDMLGREVITQLYFR